MSNSLTPMAVDHTCRKAVNATTNTSGRSQRLGPNDKALRKIFIMTLFMADAAEGARAATTIEGSDHEAKTPSFFCEAKSFKLDKAATMQSTSVGTNFCVAISRSSEYDQVRMTCAPAIVVPMQPNTSKALVHRPRWLNFSDRQHGTKATLSRMVTLASGATSETGAKNKATICPPGLTKVKISTPSVKTILFLRSSPTF
mmetsp:Transcript_80719/g.140098  ORF Transcript_80719/g.140098 Transcript_80719/m.140098 type:complete len:200 (+) Transcript_80719:351-950(+)